MKAIVLLSGGLDSTLVLALALAQGRQCRTIGFDYGQRHKIELESAKAIAKYYGVEHHVIKIDPSAFGKSSLVTTLLPHQNRSLSEISKSGTPNTYVPARNTLFLSLALAQAEIHEANEIHFGPNAMDHVYPDCRPEFLEAYQTLINVATKQSVEGSAPKIIAPLLYLTKKEIGAKAKELKVPVELTFSCYSPTSEGKACGCCDACVLRATALS